MDFPENLRRFVQDSWFLSGNTPQVRGLNGRTQYVDFENRVWTNQITAAGIWMQRIPQWSAFIHSLRGPSTVFRMPACNPYALTGNTPEELYASMGVSAGDIAQGWVPFSDGSTFSDGNGFALSAVGEPTVLVDGYAGDTRIQISGYIAELAEPGTRFTINDFLYEIERNTAGVVMINPPLREDIFEGQEAQFTNPMVKVRLASDQDARLFVNNYRFGQPVTFNVVEAFER